MPQPQLEKDLSRAYSALRIINHHNKLHHDLDAYLYEIVQWGLGLRDEPNPKDYGLEE